jgi:hypothetical protein
MLPPVCGASTSLSILSKIGKMRTDAVHQASTSLNKQLSENQARLSTSARGAVFYYLMRFIVTSLDRGFVIASAKWHVHNDVGRPLVRDSLE